MNINNLDVVPFQITRIPSPSSHHSLKTNSVDEYCRVQSLKSHVNDQLSTSSVMVMFH